MNAPVEILGTYQNDISNMRSHHWKYWIDLYTHCYYNCAYCVYRAAGQMGKITQHPERAEGLANALQAIQKKGIVYLGPQADVYQPINRRSRLAARALEAFEQTGTPVFIVTRSPDILDDLDLLRALSARGLVEVSVSIPTARVLQRIEPHTPPLAERLGLLRELRRNGVVTSVHMSPIIPYLDEPEELEELMLDCASTGAACIYACMLGVTQNYHQLMTDLLRDYDPRKADQYLSAYGEGPIEGVKSAPDELVRGLMSRLAQFSTTQGLPFACVHIPALDTVERLGGIFRFKLPTVGDMLRHFNRIGAEVVTADDLLEYLTPFPAVDDEYVASALRFWREGRLFKNTYFHQVVRGNTGAVYQRRPVLDIRVTNMRVT